MYRRYGPPDVLRVEDVETTVPKGDEVLVRVHAASINAADRVLLRGQPFMIRLAMGLTKPKHPILGHHRCQCISADLRVRARPRAERHLRHERRGRHADPASDVSRALAVEDQRQNAGQHHGNRVGSDRRLSRLHFDQVGDQLANLPVMHDEHVAEPQVQDTAVYLFRPDGAFSYDDIVLFRHP